MALRILHGGKLIIIAQASARRELASFPWNDELVSKFGIKVFPYRSLHSRATLIEEIERNTCDGARNFFHSRT